MDDATKARLMEILKGTGVGAGIGGATLGGLTAAFGEEDPNDPEAKKNKIMQNLMLGAALGGAGGAGWKGYQLAQGPESPFTKSYDRVRGVFSNNLLNAGAAAGLTTGASKLNQRNVNKFIGESKIGDRPLNPLDDAGKPLANIAGPKDTVNKLTTMGGSIKNPAVLEQLRSGLQVPQSTIASMDPATKMQYHINKANILGGQESGLSKLPGRLGDFMGGGTGGYAIPATERLASLNPMRLFDKFKAKGGGKSTYGFMQPRNVNQLTGMTKLPFHVASPNLIKAPAVAAGTYGASKLLNNYFDTGEDKIINTLDKAQPGKFR